MSATNRGRERIKDDAYETSEWVVHRLLEKLHLPTTGAWLEPCAGSGNIIRAAHSFDGIPRRWGAIEIREECRADLAVFGDQVFIGDFLSLDPRTLVPFQVMLTNPPYSHAQQFIEHGLKVADHVVVLLRLNFLGSEDRQPFLSRHTPDIYVLPNRPSFVQAVSCASGHLTCPCLYQAFFKPTEVTPKECPDCGAPVKCASSDATEYAWFHFWSPRLFGDPTEYARAHRGIPHPSGASPREHGKLQILDLTPLAVRKAKTA